MFDPGMKKKTRSPVDVLLERFDDLDEVGRQMLLDYAEFLQTKYAAPEAQSIAEPELIPRPDNESVVKAIKRLTASYSMIDRSAILHETSALMAEHVMQGRKANDVIDDLEALFERQYKKLSGQ